MTDNKRVGLFLDGTWNNVSDNTNVWRLKSLCTKSSEQLVYYSAGVGTQSGEHISGGMFGIGINEEVISAYECFSYLRSPGITSAHGVFIR
ncbi:MAG: DUF2235 domain-containing protein [Alloacidobacterium sp.]